MIDIILISTMKRMDLLEQTLQTMANTSGDDHSLTLVLDNPEAFPYARGSQSPNCKIIINTSQAGASRSRNIGASSIPKYLRKEYVCFCDDDLVFTKGWDVKMEELATTHGHGASIISGSAHPFNHAQPCGPYGIPGVISTPHFMMPWDLWDEVGFFVEPGGVGGSEDVDYCQRAAKKGWGFAVTEPHCVLHVGEHSSNGNPIVGYEHVFAHNRNLVKLYGLEGVKFS